MKTRKVVGMWIACLVMISVLSMSAASNAHEAEEVRPDQASAPRAVDGDTVVDLGKISSPADDEAEPSNGPQAVEGGIRFTFESTVAKKVFLAGDFNNWANNDNGKVSDTAFEMEGGESGVWTKVVPLDLKEIHYKFAVANEKGECAWVPDPSVTEKDTDENTVLDIRKVHSRKNRKSDTAAEAGASGPKVVEGGVLFTFESPDAHKVYIAGDFNNWANNDNGKVSGAEFEMEKGEDGVWKKIVSLSPEEHHYKFAVANEKGECTWVPDPAVTEKDQDENSVIDVGKLGAATASKKGE